MRINLRYQLILFSSFELQASPEVINTIKTELSDDGLAVTPFIETIFGLNPGGPTNVGRPRFATSDGSFSFFVKSDCLAFEWVNVDIGVSPVLSFDNFCKKNMDICERVGFFSRQNYRRIGLIRTTFIDEVNHQQVFECFSKTIKYYVGKEMKDWNLFFPAKVFIGNNVEINATSRLQHLITRINRNSQNKIFDGVSLTTDVNTVSSNSQDIYSLTDIEGLLTGMKDTEYQITNDYCNVINNGTIRL